MNNSVNVNQLMADCREEFMKIDSFQDHFDTLKIHTANTSSFLQKQLITITSTKK